MKRLLVLLLSLMLATSMLVTAEELSQPAENPVGGPANNIVVPVEPQEPQAGGPVNEPNQPKGMGQVQPQPGQPQPQPSVPGQNNFNNQPGVPNQPQDKPLPPNVGNQPGKYGIPPNVPSNMPQPGQFNPDQPEKEQQNQLPPLDENGEQEGEQEQPQEIPEGNGIWVPIKKIGNFFYFWKPKETPNQMPNLPQIEKGKGNSKNAPSLSQPGKFQDGDGAEESDTQTPEDPLLRENVDGYQFVDEQGNGEDYQATYEKDKAKTNVNVKKFKDPAEADATFQQMFDEGNMETVLVKNMKLVKRTTENGDEYLWPAHDKIFSLVVPAGESLEQNLLAFEYLSRNPSKLNPKSDTLGLPGEGLEATPEFENGEFEEGVPSGQLGDFPAMQAGVPGKKGLGQQNGEQQHGQPDFGCKSEGEKQIPYGFRLVKDDSAQYCDMDGSFKEQKELDASCQNGFECQSNQCSSGKCLDLEQQMQETRSLLEKILAWLGQKGE